MMMSPRTFPLYMLWFRILRVLRTNWRAVRRAGRGAMVRLPALARWIGLVWLAPLWMSFELYVMTWGFLERQVQARYGIQLQGWHRVLFCAGLSLTAGEAALLVITGWQVGETTLLIALAHGLAVALLWKRGLRWCRRVLGVRPVGHGNIRDPYAGLDLGN